MNALRVSRFLLALGVRLDPLKLVRATVLMVAGHAAAPLAALSVGRFADYALSGHESARYLALLAVLLLGSQLTLSHFAHLDYNELAERQETRLRVELIELVNGASGIEHLHNSSFADRVNLVREDVILVTRTLEAILQVAGILMQAAIITFILATLNPWLTLLLLVTVPPVLINRKAHAVIERAREDGAEARRRNQHFLELATTASAVKEVRLCGATDELLRRQEGAWREFSGRVSRGQLVAAGLRAIGQTIVTIGYGGAVLLLVLQALAGQNSIGDLILVIMLAVQLNVQVAGALNLLSRLQAAGQTVKRIESLRETARSVADPATRPRRSVPRRICRGIELENVSFRYPGNQQPALREVSLRIPAGATVALVGENGAGKSTLVKLLCGVYRPTAGRILVDGVDVSAFDPVEWRTRMATLFQDFYRFEFTLREGIGLGEVGSIDAPGAIASAVTRAHAQDVVEAVPGGLDGFIGRGYADGAELSGGQWQTTGLARCLMRTHPLLRFLDEPAAALDAAAEHALFERYGFASSTPEGVTVLVSHRFSTVRMADLIAVLSGGRVIETGTHQELMSRQQLYAELFQLQARAFR